MKVFTKAFVCLLAFFFIAPNAQASLTFDKEYETKQQTIYCEPTETGAYFDILDLEQVNNWNNTILPLQQQNESFRGIAQYALPFPEIVKVNRTAGAPSSWGENLTLSWYYKPDPNSIFDGHSEAWLRLPLNNLTLGSTATHTIRLAIWKPYIDQYNISLATTINDTVLSTGYYGDTPGEKIYDDYVYTTQSLTPLGYTIGNLGENYIHQDTRAVSWNATIDETTTTQTLNYNFTYVKVTTPLYRGIGYVFVVQLTTKGASAPEYEMLWSSGDMNNDFFFKSHLNISEYGQQDFDCDFDVPIIATDLVSGAYSGVGFFNTTEELRYVFEYFVNETTDPTKTLTVVIPFFSTSGGVINFTLGLASNMTSSYSVSSVYAVEIQPGSNTVIVNHSFPITSIVERIYVSAQIEHNLAKNVSFLLSQTEGIEGRTTVRYSASPYDHLYRTNAVSICRILLSTSTIGYVQLDKVFIVPNPADLEASQLYVDYAYQWAHNIQYARATFENQEGDKYDLIITITLAGLIIVATGAYIAGAPIFLPLTAGTLALYWIFRENIQQAIDYLGDKVSNFFRGILGTLGTFIQPIANFIWKVLNFVYHALSWLITNAMHLLALWCVLTTFLLAVYAGNGICSAVTKSRRERRRGEVFNVNTFDRVIHEAYAKYIRLVMFNMSLIGALFVILSTILRMVAPI